MNRQIRNRIVRWMNDHHIHYTNARDLAEGCTEALGLSEEQASATTLRISTPWLATTIRRNDCDAGDVPH